MASPTINYVPFAANISSECCVCMRQFDDNCFPLQLPCTCCEFPCSECLEKSCKYKCPICSTQFLRSDCRPFHLSFLNALKASRLFCSKCLKYLDKNESADNHACCVVPASPQRTQRELFNDDDDDDDDDQNDREEEEEKHNKNSCCKNDDDDLKSFYPTRDELKAMSITKIKTLMWEHSISWEGCLEKTDLIENVMVKFSRRGGRPQQQQQQRKNQPNRASAAAASASASASTSAPVSTSSSSPKQQKSPATSMDNNKNNMNSNLSSPSTASSSHRSPISSPSSSPQRIDQSIDAILGMGFGYEKKEIEDALRASGNDVDEAIDLLLAKKHQW